MKKIGIVSIWPLSDQSFAGTEKFVLRLARALSSEGHKVECYSPSKDLKYREFPNIHIEVLEMNSVDEVLLKEAMEKKGVKSVVRDISESLNELIKHDENEYWILNSPFFSMVNNQYRTIMVLHDNPDELSNYFGQENGKKLLEVLSNNYTHPIAVPSNHYQKVYSELLNKKISVISHALDPAFLKMTKIIQSKNRPNLEDVVKNVIFLPARLEPKQKGQDIAIKAISRLSNKNNIILKFSGHDPTYIKNQRYLESLAVDLGITLEIQNYSDKEVVEEMMSSSLILLPSRYESFGYSAQETLSLGKTVILSDIPTYVEISENAPNAVLFRSGDDRDLSKKIEKCLLEKIDIKPDTNWFERYSPENWANKYLDLFNSIINE